MSEGRLVAIFVKRAHGSTMDPHLAAVLEVGQGLVGNANRGGRRQVTIVSIERWHELMRKVGASLGPEARRANLVVSGIDLEDSRGRTLLIGGCRVVVGGETRPCEVMEEAAAGLQAAMSERWGGGAFGQVIGGGPIAVGDSVRWEV